MSRDELKLRAATRADASVIFELIKALAKYEKLSHAVTGNVASLEAHLFGEPGSDRSNYRPIAEAIIAELTGKPVGFSLFFHNYSTFLTQPGIYIEDLFVLPEQPRGSVALYSYRRLLKLLSTIDLCFLLLFIDF